MVDHRFGSGPAFTIGIEEEYMLLDPTSLDLVQRADRVLASVRDVELGVLLSQELFQSLLEVRTPVCANTAEGEQVLRRLRAQVGRRSDRLLGVRPGNSARSAGAGGSAGHHRRRHQTAEHSGSGREAANLRDCRADQRTRGMECDQAAAV